MNLNNESHTIFYADGDILCYIVMHFGLINVGATNQRMVNRLIIEMLGRNMEIYVDDMLVKSIKASPRTIDFQDAFECM